ncbi:MAG: acyl-[acyl-carrier-protein]--UDP-N-acetylglucosamine O-acyltransferase, partial [Phenylobacterium zucineum]
MTIHPTAIIAPEAKIAADVEIGPYSIVGPDV